MGYFEFINLNLNLNSSDKSFIIRIANDKPPIEKTDKSVYNVPELVKILPIIWKASEILFALNSIQATVIMINVNTH